MTYHASQGGTARRDAFAHRSPGNGELDSAVAAIVIDDSEAVRASLSQVLRDLGLQSVVAVSTGLEGLERLRELQGQRCIVFCDLAMPGMDGVEVVREIHKRGYRVGIVLISGKDRRVLDVVSDVARKTGHDVLGALQKPFSRSDVVGLLAHWHPEALDQQVVAEELPPLEPEEVRDAIASDAIEVVFEPQVALCDQQVIAVEALARLRRNGHLISPARFIAVAESNALIAPLTMVVVRKAAQHVAEWHRRGLKVALSINVSGKLAVHPDTPDTIATALAQEAFPVSEVIIELTESTTMHIESVIECVARFRLKDCRVAIDDFGTGQSTLERLRRMPFTDLKIDRSFVTGAATDPDKVSIIESSIQLAHRLGLQVTAEGVETAVDERIVRSLGCDYAQGYFYTKPIEHVEMSSWIEQWNRDVRRGART